MNTQATRNDTQPKVVAVNLNPALDLTGSLSVLEAGTVNLVERGSLHPAGKGVNVARVLAELGAAVTVTGLLGTENQDPFCELFSQYGIEDAFVRVQGASRINVKLVEASGRVSDINFPGVTVSQDDVAAMENKLFELAEQHEVFVIAGSLPAGLSPQVCAEWIKRLKEQGKKVLFDSSNQALKAGLTASPWLVKPNDEEMSAWYGKTLETPAELKSAAETLYRQDIANVVVSLGEKGVMWLDESGWLYSQPPGMEVVSTVGAGDTLVAGLCWGYLNQWNKQETLAFATALSALAVTQVGVGVPDAGLLNQTLESVQISNQQPVGQNANC
ncbi:1-phosphofructokinase [Photobacterium sp. WH24]|uniref:1-phosphofructokinase n=1 Tax=Photobacterium sp. WH24 TaxID=2827237 RepID=UPI001C43A446|nr:1-phosphofructokinase [Photobacterium sp. WH24]MBV7262414.1 1-phosphofructokinase [Photobacterium sp. WH24]